MSIVALMTDFGLHDHYVAAMKGVILQIDPRATLVDVCHEIESHDILHGAFVLRQAFPCFPAGTIFVAVVDPGVGSARRLLAARYADRLILTPDNGLLTLVHRDVPLQELRILENRRFFASTLSPTFHGRDILAPVAGHLSRGVALDNFGPVADHIDVLDLPPPRRQPDGSLLGQVLLVDRFGNLITGISDIDLSAANAPRRQHDVWLNDRPIGPLKITYSDVPPGTPLALIGSTRMLEIAVNQGRACDALRAGRGAVVRVT